MNTNEYNEMIDVLLETIISHYYIIQKQEEKLWNKNIKSKYSVPFECEKFIESN